MKKIIHLLLFLITSLVYSQNYNIQSPNEKIKVDVKIDKQVSFDVSLNNETIIEKVVISLENSDGRIFGVSPRLKKVNRNYFKEKISVPIPNKDRIIKSEYNQVILSFRGDYDIIFRAYNDGIAYRFIDKKNTLKEIVNEQMDLSFPKGSSTFFPWEESMYSHNERLYNRTEISNLNNSDFCSLPVLFVTKNGKVLFTESSLYDYPGMFLEKKENDILSSKFPNYVLKAIAKPNDVQASSDTTLHLGEEASDRTELIVTEADYISKTKGKRSFPWRVFIVSDDDRTFVESNLVTLLSEKSKIEDTSWIKPGKVAWDWWNANNIYGVDFRAGINQEIGRAHV